MFLCAITFSKPLLTSLFYSFNFISLFFRPVWFIELSFWVKRISFVSDSLPFIVLSSYISMISSFALRSSTTSANFFFSLKCWSSVTHMSHTQYRLILSVLDKGIRLSEQFLQTELAQRLQWNWWLAAPIFLNSHLQIQQRGSYFLLSSFLL